MSEPRAGDEVDRRRIRLARMAAMGLVICCLGLATGLWNVERACQGACGVEDLAIIGLPVAFGAAGLYTGIRGGQVWNITSGVAGSVLFSLSVLHLAAARPLARIHIGAVDLLEAGVGDLAFYLWWTVVAGLAIGIWEGVRIATDRTLAPPSD